MYKYIGMYRYNVATLLRMHVILTSMSHEKIDVTSINFPFWKILTIVNKFKSIKQLSQQVCYEKHFGDIILIVQDIFSIYKSLLFVLFHKGFVENYWRIGWYIFMVSVS